MPSTVTMNSTPYVEQEYISVGANRYSAASSYCSKLQCLAYGADCNIALWRPLDETSKGICGLLRGHTDKVTAVLFYGRESDSCRALLTGSANGEIALWKVKQDLSDYELVFLSKVHDGAVNSVAALDGKGYFVTGGPDGFIRLWRALGTSFEALSEIKTRPRYIPLALTLGSPASNATDDGFFLAAAGTRNDIFVYSVSDDGRKVEIACSLTGHEGWVRSLALRPTATGYLLASTSADQYTRLWRIDANTTNGLRPVGLETQITDPQQTLSAKVKSVKVGGETYSITFEALLLCHEDWAYTADWQNDSSGKLLTASADGTLAIWEPDETSGIWVSETRLGEISGQKGATTATGSSGGFWTAKWISTTCVVSLGRTGSWRIWKYNDTEAFWNLLPGVGGHTNSVNGLCWSPKGEYLLTTSSDQTTRLHAIWKRDTTETWHEFSRCQIHGYDCNVVQCTSPHQFVSGADEKLLRVFNEPKEMAEVLNELCGAELPGDIALPESAAIPVLGLSNKEVGEPDDIIEAGPRKGDDDYAAAKALAGISVRGLTMPPNEDLLSRHTLWPEFEKLYGHGYEISEAAYGHGLLATACKASSLEHAAIRLYDPDDGWCQLEPPLTAHSLTVTRLTWSPGPVAWLLSVGRDRQWSIFVRDLGAKMPRLLQSEQKAHSRMILDAVFSPSPEHPFFVTAGRDKLVKVWGHDKTYKTGSDSDGFSLMHTVSKSAAVTSIAVHVADHGLIIIAVGEEGGQISLHSFTMDGKAMVATNEVVLPSSLCPPRAVNRMAWSQSKLALACADGSVRVLRFDLIRMTSVTNGNVIEILPSS